MSTSQLKTWSFLRNPFDTPTKSSYKTMKKIADFTLSAIYARILPAAIAAKGKTTVKTTPMLAGDTPPSEFFSHLKGILEPLVDDFNAKYVAWINQQGTRKGTVSTLADKLVLLRGPHIRRWDALVQTVYLQNTPSYEAIFPKRRTPFQKGTQTERVTAVEALYDRIKDNSELPETLKTSVSDFLVSLKTDYTKSAAQKSKTTTSSDNLENARVVLCQGMYKVLGELMSFYSGDTTQIEAFFDLQSIRNIEQTVFTHMVKGGSIHKIVKRGLEEKDQLKLENIGETVLHFYLAEAENMQPGAVFVSVEAESSKNISAPELGNITSHYLMVKNMDATHDGQFIVTLL